MKKTDTSISNILNNIASCRCCPNFFITGDSCSLREKYGFEIVNMLCEKRVIDFKGIAKYFTIHLPYCVGTKDMSSFLTHLQNSVNIAQDCYDKFKGIVMVELEPGWASNDYEKCVQLFFNYIKAHENICFILLFPGRIEQKQCRAFYNEVADYGYWVSIEVASPTIDQCIELFSEKASKLGFTVKKDILDDLRVLLKNRSQEYTDNTDAVEQLLKKIEFEHLISGETKKEIDKNDIFCISGQKNLKPRIGFGTENR